MDFVITKCNYKSREKQKGRSLEPSQRMHTITWKWKQDQMETQRGPGGIYLVGPVGLNTDRVTNSSWFVWDFLIFITQVLHPRKPSVPGASVGHHMAVLTMASFPCLVGTEELLSQLLFSCSVVSSSLWPHGLQHARLPCPSPSPGACSNSCPLSQWCHPTISSSLVPFSSCPQDLPASRSFPMSQLFESCVQSIGSSALPSVLPTNIQGWSPLRLTGLISLLSKGFSRVFSNNTTQKHQFFGTQPSLWSNSYIHTWLLEKP